MSGKSLQDSHLPLQRDQDPGLPDSTLVPHCKHKKFLTWSMQASVRGSFRSNRSFTRALNCCSSSVYFCAVHLFSKGAVPLVLCSKAFLAMSSLQNAWTSWAVAVPASRAKARHATMTAARLFWTTLDSDSILDSPSASASPKFSPKFPRTCRRTLFFAREEGKQRERECRPPSSSIETETGTRPQEEHDALRPKQLLFQVLFVLRRNEARHPQGEGHHRGGRW